MKTKKAKKTKLFFQEVIKLHPNTISRSLSPDLHRRLLPRQLLKDLIPDDPLHPDRDRQHPFLYLPLDLLRILFPLFQKLLFQAEIPVILISEGRALDFEMLFLIRKPRVTALHIGLDHGLPFLFQAPDILLRLLNQPAGIYVIIQNLLVYGCSPP